MTGGKACTRCSICFSNDSNLAAIPVTKFRNSKKSDEFCLLNLDSGFLTLVSDFWAICAGRIISVFSSEGSGMKFPTISFGTRPGIRDSPTDFRMEERTVATLLTALPSGRSGHPELVTNPEMFK